MKNENSMQKIRQIMSLIDDLSSDEKIKLLQKMADYFHLKSLSNCYKGMLPQAHIFNNAFIGLLHVKDVLTSQRIV